MPVLRLQDFNSRNMFRFILVKVPSVRLVELQQNILLLINTTYTQHHFSRRVNKNGDKRLLVPYGPSGRQYLPSRETIRHPLGGFSLNRVFGHCYEMCREISFFIEI